MSTTMVLAIPCGFITLVLLKLLWKFRLPYVLGISGFAIYSYFYFPFNRAYFMSEIGHCFKERCFSLKDPEGLKRFHLIGSKFKDSPQNYEIYQGQYQAFLEEIKRQQQAH